MISQEEPYFCYNVTVRKAAGIVGIATFVLGVAMLLKTLHELIDFDEDPGVTTCFPIKKHLQSSCKQVLKTIWMISFLAVIDSALVILVSLILCCGVLREATNLLMPYMMWIKMTLSIYCVLCIFLTSAFRIEIVSSKIIGNMALVVIYGFFSYVVKLYDDVLLKRQFNNPEFGRGF